MNIPPPRLTLAQGRLLKALEIDCDAGDPPTRLLNAVPPRLLAQWLRSATFRRRLKRLLRVVRHRREVALCLASARAADRLAAGVDDADALDANQRRLCVDLIRLARGSSLAQRRPTRARDPAAPDSACRPAVHPDVPAGEVDALLSQFDSA